MAGCPDGTAVPASPTIADFTPADGGPSIEFMGGTTSFGTPAPELKVSGSNLHAQATVVAGAEPRRSDSASTSGGASTPAPTAA